MLRASVLIPTHEHAATLPFAVASVQAQGADDIEILIVGDGVDDTLRAAINRLQADDSRIRFFDFPKGPRHGEIHRGTALREARGRIICYQCDDDLWLPGHLADMEAALESADFVGSMAANVTIDGQVWGCFFDLERPEFRTPWLVGKPTGFGNWANAGFGLSSGAHRLEAYQRLPEGWTTTPAGIPTDQFMWMKFVRQPWCKTKVLPWPTSLRFAELQRRGWNEQQHAAEKGRWMQIMASRDGTQQVYRELLRKFGDILLLQDQTNASAEARSATAEAERAAAQAGRTAAEAERDAILNSTSWRLTAPMRAMLNFFRQLKSPQNA